MIRFLLFCLIFFISNSDAQQESKTGEFVLPNLSRQEPSKPTISPDLAHYFQLPDAGARRFVSSYFPGLVPPPTFEIADPQHKAASTAALNGLFTGGSGLQLPVGNALSGPSGTLAANALQALLGNGNANAATSGAAAGLGSGLALPPGLPLSPGFSVRPAKADPIVHILGNDTTDDNDTSAASGSSINGIPKIFPTLPKAPIPQSPVLVPSLPTRPIVPEGGLGPLASLESASASSFGSGLNPQPNSPFLPGSGLQAAVPNLPVLSQSGLLQQPQQTPVSLPVAAAGSPLAGVGGPIGSAGAFPQPNAGGNDNLISQLLRTFGLSNLTPNLDLSAVNSVLGLTPQTAAASNSNPGLLSNVVYSALTDGKGQTSQNLASVSGNAPLSAALGNASEIVNNKANAALIQNLLTQPNSPLCNPKPQPVETFNVDAFMGKWYQVLYSPPLSGGPCSMVTYQKLADVGQGGPGTVFDTFEYTTDATPYGKPRVSSGYGIVRGPGQMIYRTTNSASDVNVYILETGPTNELGQYDYVVLAVNCNYPLHVFARDPVQYKQKYEAEVNSALEQRSLVTSWSRLLNLVAPVDYNLCTFPPTLFNVRG